VKEEGIKIRKAWESCNRQYKDLLEAWSKLNCHIRMRRTSGGFSFSKFTRRIEKGTNPVFPLMTAISDQ